MNLGVELRSWRLRARAESYPESFPSEPACVAAVASVGGVASESGHDGRDEFADFLNLVLAPGGDEVAGEGPARRTARRARRGFRPLG